MTALELAPIGDSPKTRRETDVVLDGAELALGLDMEANPRRGREAEFPGKQADLLAVVPDELVERVLDRAPSVPHERTAPAHRAGPPPHSD